MRREFVDLGLEFLNERSLDRLEDFDYSIVGHLKTVRTGKELEDSVLGKFSSDIEVFKGIKVIGDHEPISNQKKFIRGLKDTRDFILLQSDREDLAKPLINEELIDGLYLSFENRDSVISEGMVSLLSQTNIPVLIPFKPIIEQEGYIRSQIIRRMSDEVNKLKECGVSIVITSGANSYWNLRSPRELMSFGYVLGMTLMEAKSALTSKPLNILE